MNAFKEPDPSQRILYCENICPDILKWIDRLIDPLYKEDDNAITVFESELKEKYEKIKCFPDEIRVICVKFIVLYHLMDVSILNEKALEEEQEIFDWEYFLKSRAYDWLSQMLGSTLAIIFYQQQSNQRFKEAMKSVDCNSRIHFYKKYIVPDEIVAEIEGIAYFQEVSPDFLFLITDDKETFETLLQFVDRKLSSAIIDRVPSYNSEKRFSIHWLFLLYITKENSKVLEHIYSGSDLVSIFLDINNFFSKAHTNPEEWFIKEYYKGKKPPIPDMANFLPSRDINTPDCKQEIYDVFMDYIGKAAEAAENEEILCFIILLFRIQNKPVPFRTFVHFPDDAIRKAGIADILCRRIIEPVSLKKLISVIMDTGDTHSQPIDEWKFLATEIFSKYFDYLINEQNTDLFIEALPLFRLAEEVFNADQGSAGVSFLMFLDRRYNGIYNSVIGRLSENLFLEKDAVRIVTLDGIDKNDGSPFMMAWQGFLASAFLKSRKNYNDMADNEVVSLLNNIINSFDGPNLLNPICAILAMGKVNMGLFSIEAVQTILLKTVQTAERTNSNYLPDENALIISSVLILSGSQAMDDYLDSLFNRFSSDEPPRDVMLLKLIKEFHLAKTLDLNEIERILRKPDIIGKIPSKKLKELPIDHDSYIAADLDNRLQSNAKDKLSVVINKFLYNWDSFISNLKYPFVSSEKNTITERGKIFFKKQIEERLAHEISYEGFSNFHVCIWLAYLWDLSDESATADNAVLFSEVIENSRKLFNSLRAHVRFNEEIDYCDAAYDCVFPAAKLIACKTSYWKALKQILLIFRHISCPILSEELTADLKVNRDEIPVAFESILRGIKNEDMYRQCRLDMVHDLAEFLKPIHPEQEISQRSLGGTTGEGEGFDPSRKEPDPNWRYAYVRAIGDLGVDPNQKGHYFHDILKRVAESDPSEMVRYSAKKIYEELSLSKDGWKKGSHKRLLFHAWWWIKQAHMISTGGKISEEGALRTRNTEFR